MTVTEESVAIPPPTAICGYLAFRAAMNPDVRADVCLLAHHAFLRDEARAMIRNWPECASVSLWTCFIAG